MVGDQTVVEATEDMSVEELLLKLCNQEPPAATPESPLSCNGRSLLEGLLAWLPERSPPAAEVADHAFFAPERFALHSNMPCFQGSRHPWNMLVGATAAEVLEWLRGDAALQPNSPEFAALAGATVWPHGWRAM